MKTFTKIALVSAISAAPFMAQAALEPMSESLMSDTTGQAGVTIEIDLGSAGIKVGSVVYTDTQEGADTDGGSVSMENIGVNLTGTLVQTIDVDGAGDLKMTLSSPGALNVTMGNDAADTTGLLSAVKLVAIDGSESELVNNLNMSVNLGSSTTTIKNLGNAASFGLGPLSGAGVTGTYATGTSSMAIQMNASVEVTDMDLGLFGYTNAQADVLGDGSAAQYAAGYAAAQAADIADATGTTQQDAYTAASASDADNDGAITGAELVAVKNAIATGSAIQVENVTVAANGGGAITLNQVIWAVGGDASAPGSEAGVYIQLGSMDMNIGVESIKIGGASIGGLAINGLELAGMTQRIYGHE